MDGATRSQLADRVGISVQYVCDIEEGRRTLKRNPDLVNRFAEALNVPKSWLTKRDVVVESTADEKPAAKPAAKKAAKKPVKA